MSGPVLKAWEISEAEFPTRGTPAEKFRFLLHYAVLAPSNHNTQPWLFKLGDDYVELYADRTRALPVADPEDRELTIACGAALMNLRIALRHFGYMGAVETFPKADTPDLLARIRLGHPTKARAEEHMLFQAILKRGTNRKAFEDREVPEALLSTLQAAACEEGAWLEIVEDEDSRYAVSDLIAEGDRRQWADKRFRRELALWSHSNRSVSHDGIPGYAFGMSDMLSQLSPFVIQTFNMGDGTAAKNRQLATGAPVLVVLGTEADTPRDWLSAGQALAKILLFACSEGVWASFLNQPIQIDELRDQLRMYILEQTGPPQLLLRMGYGPKVHHTPRRSVSEVVF